MELEIDRTRLTQVLTNLMTNAIKYTDRGGKITVRLTSRDDGVRIAVTDTGAGLTRSEIERIFEMFHQSRTPHTQSVGGLGVGLSVARSLAELHGGGLLAESPGPGKGATFTLWLPRLTDSQAVDFSVPSLTPHARHGGPAVVARQAHFAGGGFRRTRARRWSGFLCGARATSRPPRAARRRWKMVKREPPEIIISDLGLPGMSGFEFMKELRKHEEWRDVVAMALSGLGREKDIRGATEAGFDAHLLKPVDMAVLDQTLADALKKRAKGKLG